MIQGTQPNWQASFPNSVIASPCAYSFTIIEIQQNRRILGPSPQFLQPKLYSFSNVVAGARTSGTRHWTEKVDQKTRAMGKLWLLPVPPKFPGTEPWNVGTYQFDYDRRGTIPVNPYLGVFTQHFNGK